MLSIEIAGIILTAFIVVSYGVVVWLQYRSVTQFSFRVTVLDTRIALYLPLLALCVLLELFLPISIPAVPIAVNFIEGYALKGFLYMVISNVGGTRALLSLMKESGRSFNPCWCVKNTHPLKQRVKDYYVNTHKMVFNLVYTRPILAVATCACDYYQMDNQLPRLLGVIFNIIGIIILVRGLVMIGVVYESVMTSCRNMHGLAKIVLLKLSVMVLVIDGFIAQVISRTQNADHLPDSILRRYSIAILGIFAAFVIPYLYIYGRGISAPIVSIGSESTKDEEANKEQENVSVVITPSLFLSQVMMFHDIFDRHNIVTSSSTKLSSSRSASSKTPRREEDILMVGTPSRDKDRATVHGEVHPHGNSPSDSVQQQDSPNRDNKDSEAFLETHPPAYNTLPTNDDHEEP